MHAQGIEIIKRTNERLHSPDRQVVSSFETKAGIKRKARKTQVSSHNEVSESFETVSEGAATKLRNIYITVAKLSPTMRCELSCVSRCFPLDAHLCLIATHYLLTRCMHACRYMHAGAHSCD